MKKILLTTLAASTLWLSHIATSQADVLFRPRATLGLMSYSLDNPNTQSNATTATATIGGVGATIATENFYIDIATSTTLTGTHDGYIVAAADEEFERNDFIVTVGTSITDTASIFVGYRDGTTSIHDDNYTIPYLAEFHSSGIFGGASLGIATETGALSVSGAIAFLAGELTDNSNQVPPYYIEYDAEADTIGFSLGISYSSFFSETAGISLRGGFQSYSYVDFQDPNYFGSNQIPDLTETIFSADASIFFNF